MSKPGRSAPVASPWNPHQYLRRLDGTVAVIDVRSIEAKDQWIGVPVCAVVLFAGPSEPTDTFGVNLFRYRGIWICTCWLDGKPGYHKHPLFGEDWPPWRTYWEITRSEAREWFINNHQPVPEELLAEPEAASPAAAPRADEKTAAAPASGTAIPEATGPPVVLGKMGDKPIVRGKPKDRLTPARYNIVKALLDAGDKGLTGDDLVNKSSHGGAVNTLKALAKSDADWGAVISLPGQPGARYRIVSKSDGS